MQKSILGNTFNEVDNVDTHGEVLGRDLSSQDFLEGIYVFISVDLVNSTIFKTRFTKYWPFVIQAFYKIITNALGAEEAYRSKEDITYIGQQIIFDSEKMRTGGFKVWKLVGDEVLIYHKIVSVSELLNTVRIMDYVTSHIIEYFIRQGEEKYTGEELEEFVRIARRHLAAKTTMWVAQCGSNITLDCPNMYYDASGFMDSTDRCLDFLGPDIDAGFRLCGYAEKNKVVISPNLVALLSVQLAEKDNVELSNIIRDAFRIVTYVELEDVWEKRLYPVFMYCYPSEKGNRMEAWRKLFEYDEKKTSQLAGFIFDESIKFDSDEFSYKQLEKIYMDLGRTAEIEALQSCFKKQIECLKSDESRPMIDVPHSKFEFHISCLCVHRETNGTKKVWIHNHPNHGLSFGCIRINVNHEYKEKVTKEYKEKYGIDIDFGAELDFVDFYAVNREGKKEEILGLIISVDAEPLKGVKCTKENGWYSLKSVKGFAKGKKKISNFDEVIDKLLAKVG